MQHYSDILRYISLQLRSFFVELLQREECMKVNIRFRVKEIAVLKGMSLDDLIVKTGIDPKTVTSMWENSTQDQTIAIVATIAGALRTNLNDLVEVNGS
jgi:DNA-binding Xre family transcriptional regulator